MEFLELSVRSEKTEYSRNEVVCLEQTLYSYSAEDATNALIYLPPEQAIIVAKEMIRQANILINAKKVDS